MICSIRLVRFWAERKRSFSNWKIAQIRARPMTTRSEARSPWTSRRSVSPRHRASALRCLAVPAAASLIAPPPRSRRSRRELLLARRSSSSSSEPSPVIAETTCSSVVASALKSPAGRPSRKTKIRSATSKTSTRLWLITTTPSSRSRRRRISSSTCAVWATPSAAVGSSSSTTFGSPSSERATATCWRWPPERVPTSLRRLGIVTARLESSSPVWCSIRASSSWREAVPSPGETSSRPRKRLATTSRLSQRARSW